MGLCLFSEDGWVDNIGSAGAVSYLTNTVSTRTDVPALEAFLSSGVTHDIAEVVDDLNVLIPRITDKDAKGVAQGLRDSLNKIKDKEVAIISQ